MHAWQSQKYHVKHGFTEKKQSQKKWQKSKYHQQTDKWRNMAWLMDFLNTVRRYDGACLLQQYTS